MVEFLAGMVCGALVVWASPKVYAAGRAWYVARFGSDEDKS
jgi:hypothetical protein